MSTHIRNLVAQVRGAPFIRYRTVLSLTSLGSGPTTRIGCSIKLTAREGCEGTYKEFQRPLTSHLETTGQAGFVDPMSEEFLPGALFDFDPLFGFDDPLINWSGDQSSSTGQLWHAPMA